MVAVEIGEGMIVGVEVEIRGIGVCVAVGGGWLDGEQAVMVMKSAISIEINFVA
jgi:hypothetical protein